MKFSAVLAATLALATVAFGYPHQPIGDQSHFERLDGFLNFLPDGLRDGIKGPIHDAIANGERPQIPDHVREQIQEHLAGLKQQHQDKLDRFLASLPEELRQEVEADLEQAFANGGIPKPSEELREKIRDHFETIKAEKKQRLDKFLSQLPEDLREEAEELLRAPLPHGGRPQASEELREKIREHLAGPGPKGPKPEQLDHLISKLPEDLRQEVELLLKQALANGERPQISEELREKIRAHFEQLKGAHRQ